MNKDKHFLMIMHNIKKYLRFGYSQISCFLEIVLLKLRMFGFADKRSVLMTKFGETLYKSHNNGEFKLTDDFVTKIANEIKESEHEIKLAEQKIHTRREMAKNAYLDLMNKPGYVSHNEPSP